MSTISLMSSSSLRPTYRHIAVLNLALYAQRLGKLFASTSTWYKMLRVEAPPKAGASLQSQRRTPTKRPNDGMDSSCDIVGIDVPMPAEHRLVDSLLAIVQKVCVSSTANFT